MAEQSELEAIQEQILGLFPVGSQWYDCRNDTVGTVVLHFKPRGLVMRERGARDGGDLVRYGYGQLLVGLLVKPTAKQHEAFDAYRERVRRVDQEYTAALAGAGFDTSVWSDA